jgi:hypothetical protein
VKNLGLKQQHSDACKSVERLRTEVRSMLESWALFENSNSYPTMGRRGELLNKVNKNGEAWGIQNIRLLAIRDTVLTIHRLFDSFDNGKNAEVQSLLQLKNFLDQKGSLEFLVSEARNWNPGRGLEDSNESLVQKLHSEVTPRLKLKGSSPIRNIGSIKKTISELRNKTLAHALSGQVENPPKLFDIRDGVVLVCILVRKCSLMIAGTDWDSKLIWRKSLKNANALWNRYESGFHKD